MTINVKAFNESEMKWIESELRNQGFEKTSDCMWAKIYKKKNLEYVISREF